MKPLIIAISAIFTLTAFNAVAKEKEKSTEIKTILVPKGKTYVKLDAKKKVIARFTQGQTMKGVTNCAKIDCPSTFPKDWVCWECRTDPGTSTTGTTGTKAEKKQ